MRKITFILSAFIASHCIGQINMSAYQFTQTNGTYTPIVNGTLLGTDSNNNEVFNNSTIGIASTSQYGKNVKDIGFPVGFDFIFKGFTFKSFSVATDGYVQLGNGKFNAINAQKSVLDLLSPLSPAISAFNTNLRAKTGSILQFKTIGTQPNRQLVVQWNDYGYKDCSDEEKINFQIILTETANTIEFVYGNFIITNATPQSALVGAGGNYTDAITRTTSSLWASTTVGVSWDVCQFSSSSFPSNGLTFIWTPPVGPIVKTYNPVFEADNTAASADLVFTFNEPIQKGTGNILIKSAATNSTLQTIDVNSTDVTISGNTVTINPNDYPAASVVYVILPEGIFKDMSGNSYSGLKNNSFLNMKWLYIIGTPGDITSPSITIKSPADNAANVLISNPNISMTFDEPVLKGIGNIYFKESGILKKVVDVNEVTEIIGNRVSITYPFGYGTSVNIEIDPGAFKDFNGNLFAGISTADSWNFTIETDITAPIIAETNPFDDAILVSKSQALKIFFSEPMQKGSGNIFIKEGGNITQTINVTASDIVLSGIVVTINHNNFTLGANVNIEIEQGAFKDLSGINFAGISSASIWNFRVSTDITAPTINLFNPVNGAINIPVDVDVTLTFNEEVQVTTELVKIKEDGILKQEAIIARAGGSTDTKVRIFHDAFKPGAKVNIEIPLGAIKDKAGNDYIGISSATEWSFTVVGIDVVPPTIGTKSPLDNANDVNKTDNLSITFSESVQKGIGNILIEEGGIVKQTIDVSGSNVTINGATVIINPPNDFTASASVVIKIDAGAFKDLSGNNYPGLADAALWNFTIKATTNGITELIDREDFIVYPNPFKDEFTIETSSGVKQNQHIEVINLMGQTLYTSLFLSKGTIDVSFLPEGIYILKLISEESVMVKRLIKY